ncbi:hypothetical protein [Candidatus Palauibacter sp.]|uniref:hypothetical protein n=1 Tax=Candidatus Palauibacter sp. TaxID=3101350 RepID=UPI003B5233E3
MRFVMRLLVFVVLILAAFWFTARNAGELVNVVLPFVRIRASLPLIVFACILGGMGLSAALAWRTERRARRLADRAASARLAQGRTPAVESRASPEPPVTPEPAAATEPAVAPAPPESAEPSEPSPLL